MPFAVRANVPGVTRNQNLARFLHQHFIAQGQATAAQSFHPRPDSDQITVSRRGYETGVHLRDGQVEAPGFKAGVVAPFLAHILAAPHLKPDEVIGVIDHAHGICLGVTDADGSLDNFSILHHTTYLSHTSAIIPANRTKRYGLESLNMSQAFLREGLKKRYRLPALRRKPKARATPR